MLERPQGSNGTPPLRRHNGRKWTKRNEEKIFGTMFVREGVRVKKIEENPLV